MAEILGMEERFGLLEEYRTEKGRGGGRELHLESVIP